MLSCFDRSGRHIYIYILEVLDGLDDQMHWIVYNVGGTLVLECGQRQAARNGFPYGRPKEQAFGGKCDLS